MPEQPPSRPRVNGPRHHWILYVFVALFGGLAHLVKGLPRAAVRLHQIEWRFFRKLPPTEAHRRASVAALAVKQ